MEEAGDKKPAAVPRVEPNEVKTAPVDTTEVVEEAEASSRTNAPTKDKATGTNSIYTGGYSICKKGRQE